MDERLDLLSVLQRITDGVYALDRSWRYTYLNAAAERQVGRPAADLLGRVCWDVFPETIGSPFEDASRRAEAEDRPVTIEAYYSPLDTWFESTYYPAPDGYTIVSRDISAQKRAEELLERNRDLLEESQRSAHIGSWEWDIVGNVVTWSAELFRIYGLAPGTSPRTYETFLQLVHPEDRAAQRAAVEQAYRAGTPFSLDHRIIRPDGAVRWLNGRGRVIRDERDRPVRMIGSAQDITERKRAEAALREHEALLRTITDNASLALFLMDARQHCTYMNPVAEELTGFTLAETRGRPLHDVIHHTRPDGTHYPRAECPIDRALPERNRTQGEEIFVHKDGHFYPVAYTASPILRNTVPVGTVIEIVDLTERKAAESRLRSSEQRHRLALDAAQAGTFDIDLTPGAPPDVTEEALRLFGFPPGGTPDLEEFLARVHPDDRELVEASFGSSVEAAAGFYLEFRVVRPDNSEVWLASRADTVRNEQGRASHLIGVLFDISERRAAQQQQQEFLESVSHDLKNPLASVRAHVQLLQRRARRGTLTTADLPGSLEKIEHATRRMEAQIEELQDVARLRAGHPLELRPALVNLAEVAAEAVAEAAQTAPHRQVRLDATGPGPGPGPLGRWDPMRLRRVIDNLLSNALKYSDRGEVLVTVGQAESADGCRALLSVRDEGLGIPAADLPHIFERFRRGSNVSDRRQGAGIGLAGARRIVHQHGGELSVTSEEGRGSTFTVSLPLTPRSTPGR